MVACDNFGQKLCTINRPLGSLLFESQVNTGWNSSRESELAGVPGLARLHFEQLLYTSVTTGGRHTSELVSLLQQQQQKQDIKQDFFLWGGLTTMGKVL